MTFKLNWEKASTTHKIPSEAIRKMVRIAYQTSNINSYEILLGGCANINVKVMLRDIDAPLLLRIYLRDKDAALREQKIAMLIKKNISVPNINFVGEVDGYTFAFAEFIKGIPLSELLLSNVKFDLGSIMHDVGV